MDTGSFLWDVAPMAGEAAVEQLETHVHGRPGNSHIFVIPRLCTCHWRKNLGKICNVLLTLQPIHKFWGHDMHEPVILGLYLPLLPPLTVYRPWWLKYTKYVRILEWKMRRVQASHEHMTWNQSFARISVTGVETSLLAT